MKISMWFKLMSISALLIWIWAGISGIFITVEVLGVRIESPTAKFITEVVAVVIVGGLYRLVGFLGSWILFPIYYAWRKWLTNRELIKRSRWPKSRVTLGFALWIALAITYSLTGGEKGLDFLGESKVAAFFFGLVIAPAIGAFLRVLGYIGTFLLSPIYLLCKSMKKKTG